MNAVPSRHCSSSEDPRRRNGSQPPMSRIARVLITGSTTGLGEAAARALLDQGHEVVLHARTPDRADSVADLGAAAAGVVVGDLASVDGIRQVADEANAIGGLDAVIHNAAVYVDPQRVATPEG